jgi:hypothetical protein
MLNRIPTNLNKSILLRNLSINSRALINNQIKQQSLNNNSIIFSNARRYLAQQQQQNQPQLNKSELDKPQWERSDRYVNKNCNSKLNKKFTKVFLKKSLENLLWFQLQ